MAEEIRMREFAPEMNAIRQRFDAECPQLAELLERLLNKVNPKSVEEINTTVQNIISGAQAIGADGSGDVEWFIQGVPKHTGRRVNIESQSPNLQLTAPLLIFGDLMEYIFTLKPGGEVAPFSKLFEWNRATELPQFSFQSVVVAGSPPGPTWNRTVVTAQSSSAVLVTPYFELKTSGPPAQHQDGFLYAANGMSAKVIGGERQDIEFIVTFGDLSTAGIDTAGFIIAKNGSETTDYYLVGLTSTNIKLWKRIAGTYHLQGDMQGWAGPTAKAFSRIRVVLTKAGRLRVFGPTNTTDMYDCPMTLGNTTVISSGDVVKPGILLGYRGSPVSMTFAVMNAWSAPIGADGEQMRL